MIIVGVITHVDMSLWIDELYNKYATRRAKLVAQMSSLPGNLTRHIAAYAIMSRDDWADEVANIGTCVDFCNRNADIDGWTKCIMICTWREAQSSVRYWYYVKTTAKTGGYHWLYSYAR